VAVAPLLDRLGSVIALIDTEAVALARLRAAETTGRPLGITVTPYILSDFLNYGGTLHITRFLG